MKITSRLGVLLAKIAGKEATLEHMTPPWATNAEEELMLEIADRVNGLESASVPEVASADKGKYLHANESTGAIEWAEASGGGSSAVVVHVDWNTGALDRTWTELLNASKTGLVYIYDGDNTGGAVAIMAQIGYSDDPVSYYANFSWLDGNINAFSCSTADGYPVSSD